MKLQRHSGFTLIELIVVLVLIGVLAVSVVPRFFDASGTSEYVYRDQVLNLLRRVQMQAMQCTDCSESAVVFYNNNIYVGLNNCNIACIEPGESNISIIKPTGINAKLGFDAMGRPSENCKANACRITVKGTVDLHICLEAEGYIHPC